MLLHIYFDNEKDRLEKDEHYFVAQDQVGNLYLLQEDYEGLKMFHLYTDKDIDVVQRIHASWEPPHQHYSNYYATCSHCGYKDMLSSGDDEDMLAIMRTLKRRIPGGYRLKRYCPNCGAYMDKTTKWQDHINELRKELENEKKN